MSTGILSKVMVPRVVQTPGGADWAASLIDLCREGLSAVGALARAEAAAARPALLAVWRHFEALGQARARRDLLAMAERRAIDNPGYANDLRAAAGFLAVPDEQPGVARAEAAGAQAASR